MKRTIVIVGVGLLMYGLSTGQSGGVQAEAEEEKPLGEPQLSQPTGSAANWVPAVEPKPLSDHVKRGLAWLVATQHENGGWSQGEESTHMGQGVAHLKAKPNVADTCVSALALMRAGSTPESGPHAQQIRRGLDSVCSQIEESDSTSLNVTDVRGTRVQAKLGPYVDTFLAALVLAEVKDQMPDEKSRQRVAAALAKVIDKIEKNQKQDGTWDNRGWASVMSQSLASKALNRAAQMGVPVDAEVLERAERQARGRFDEKSGEFVVGFDAAGVELYAAAGSLSSMQESDNTNATREEEIEKKLKQAKTQAERAELGEKLRRIEANRAELGKAVDSIVRKLDDQRFMAGFGSNGGEEFLSYLMIGESLVVQGGQEWKSWDRSITGNLNRIQNQDGSWTGHHCITGRNFCTASALLVLTIDRARIPLAAKVKGR